MIDNDARNVISYLQVHNHYGITNRDVKEILTLEKIKGFQDAEQKRSTTSTFDGYNKPSKNSKIQALLNEIINDSISTAKPLPTTSNEEKAHWKQSTTFLPPPLQEVVVEVF